MATHDDVRRIASRLPGAVEDPERLVFSVPVKGKLKGFLWPWMERVHPKKARVENPGVLAIVVPNLTAKELFITSEPDKYFSEPHYNGFPAVLVRLEAVEAEDLEDLIVEAWRAKAPADLVREFDRAAGLS